MIQFDKVKKLLFKFSDLGIAEAKFTGATLIGKASHISEYAWLNCIYPPITSDEIGKIEAEIKKTIPTSYAEFLMESSNGLNVLCNTFSLYGYRFNYIREVNWMYQPYSLIDVNNFDKPCNSTEDMLFIGFYDWDGSLLYMTPDQKVHLCSSSNSQSLMTWDSLYSMLISEIERLYTLFDSKGVQIDETMPTTPRY